MIVAIAAAWGFAEATVFFIVPDALVSAVALGRLRLALWAAVAAAAGAAAGGAVMHTISATDAGFAQSLIMSVPAIGAGMVSAAAEAFARDGVSAMLAGAWSGIPYKIFAVAAGIEGRPLLPFLAATIAVRLPRFLFAALATHLAGRLLRRLSIAARAGVLAGFWTLFYVFYFATVGG